MKEYNNNLIRVFNEKWPDMAFLEMNIRLAVEKITERVKEGGKILVCGNGGSAADSEHIVGELLKEFYIKRPLESQLQEDLKNAFREKGRYLGENLQGAIPAISLISQTGFLTAYGNDAASDLAFAQQVHAYGTDKDVLIGLSTSGDSRNVNYAAMVAKQKGTFVIALTGETGGDLRIVSDILLNVPAKETYLVQEYHLPLYHLLCRAVEYEIFGET